jgi:dUTP pyrophosphatase
MNKIKVKVKKLHADAKVPIHASEEAAGFDFYSIEDVEIAPGQTVLVRTGLSFEIPKSYCYQIWDRSGMGVKGIHHFAGLIDSDYRGEIKIVLHNSTSNPYKIVKGDRIAQGIFLPYFQGDFEEVQELNDSKRGQGGFHSTGK